MRFRPAGSAALLVAFVGLACSQSDRTGTGQAKGGSNDASATSAGGSGGKTATGRGGNAGGGGGWGSDVGGAGGRGGQIGGAGSSIVGGAAGGSTGAGGIMGGRSGSAALGGTAGSVAGQSGSAGTGSAGRGGMDTDAGAGGSGDASTASLDAAPEAGVAPYMPCPTDGSACKVLPYGDSITQGFPFAAQGGYRAPLFHVALADKKKITFIGRLSDGPGQVDNVTFAKNHEGHFAMTIEWLTDNKNVPDDVIRPAHIVLLHAGTNNRSGKAADAAKKLEVLIDKILAAAPNALLLVSTIIPCGDNGPEDAFVRDYDPLIPPIVQKRAQAGKHIQLVDQYATFDPVTMFSPPEKYHPNLVGYAHMADIWYAALKPVLP